MCCTAADVYTFKDAWNRYDHELWEGCRQPTEREVLRVLMAIFDPLGLIAPFLMFIKILLQEIWRIGNQWDNMIDDNAFVTWRNWLQALTQIEQVRIPRCLRSQAAPGSDEVQLYTFVDASENSMAATFYLRFLQDETVQCCLVAAKTRIAPLRYLLIQRFELMAAVIGIRFSRTVLDSLSFNQLYHSEFRDVI